MHQVRKWVALTVGLIAIVGVVYLRPVSAVKAQGVILPAQQVRPATNPKLVTVYASAPSQYQFLGRVRVEYHDNGHASNAYNVLVAQAQKLAASVGANGIIVNGLYHTKAEGIDDVLSSYQFYAKAIYVGAKA